ncbi:MAG: ATP-binding protein, partial [Chloroflexi bacterium]|nr:ATP-binding protein [Chloroflexota bacterium]
LDYRNRDENSPVTFCIFFSIEDKELPEVRNLLGTSNIYFEFTFGQNGKNSFAVSNNTFAEVQDFNLANKLLRALVQSHWNQHVDKDVIFKEFTDKSGQLIFDKYFRSALPQKIETIPEFRKSEPGGEYEFNGKGLIELLGNYRVPEIGQDPDQDKFRKIQNAVRRLLNLPNASLEIPKNHDHIIINNEGLRLPLSSYGTGVHELVILITAVLSLNSSLCCIEEPEIHLHPILQREFLRFLIEETDNQYLISSHSPTFINSQLEIASGNSSKIQVFLLQRIDKSTVGGPIVDRDQVITAVRELGVKPSDLLQCNCVIWVEGPSDRTFINKWISLIDSDLVEGRHYSIMFYGGRLASHLSVDFETVPEGLIQLLKINQRAIVIMDSDKDAPRRKLGKTKLRIRQECEHSDSYCWITEGREIENYIALKTVTRWLAYRANVEPETATEQGFGAYDRFEDAVMRIASAMNINSIDYSSNKIKFAYELVEHFSVSDMDAKLRKQIGSIIDLIKKWNN